jgi:hypothetical protein
MDQVERKRVRGRKAERNDKRIVEKSPEKHLTTVTRAKARA